MSSKQREVADRVALITGGAQGIGKGVALHLARQGWLVIVADVDEEAGHETVSEIGSGSEFIQVDVSREPEVAACMEQLSTRFGALDALVTSAGLASPTRGPVESLPLEAWQRVIDVNLTGTFLCVRHSVPLLRKRGGAVVTIASTRALQSEPDSEPYAASKGGILALTHALSVSLGPDIRVNAISPGWIDVSGHQKRSERKAAPLRPQDHAQHPAGRVGTPGDIAHTVEFLISDGAGFVTGQNFVIDGGMVRKMIYEH